MDSWGTLWYGVHRIIGEGPTTKRGGQQIMDWHWWHPKAFHPKSKPMVIGVFVFSIFFEWKITFISITTICLFSKDMFTVIVCHSDIAWYCHNTIYIYYVSNTLSFFSNISTPFIVTMPRCNRPSPTPFTALARRRQRGPVPVEVPRSSLCQQVGKPLVPGCETYCWWFRNPAITTWDV